MLLILGKVKRERHKIVLGNADLCNREDDNQADVSQPLTRFLVDQCYSMYLLVSLRKYHIKVSLLMPTRFAHSRLSFAVFP
jgi:hypothetical protein